MVVGVVAGGLLAACGGGTAHSSAPLNPPVADTAIATTVPASSSIAVTVPPSTTTVPATTTVPPTTTTTVIADATTADPKVLAHQLQAVLDRYIDLYMVSRSDPNRPFTDQALIDSFRDVATVDFIGTFLVPKWTQYRDEGTAARRGPARVRALVATSVSVVGRDEVQSGVCGFDDGVTYGAADGVIVDDSIAVQHGAVRFLERDGGWRIDQISLSSTAPADSSSQDVCESEAP
jgi:hypothetical protein